MVAVLQREKRIFLPEEFVIDSWEALKPFFEELKSRELNSVLELEKWILERSEMDSVLEEDMAWRYIKMNIDTDTQWAFWDGVRGYVAEHKDYLQGQIGNPEGEDKPNKSHYDPRKWIRSAEVAMVKRLERAFNDLNCVGRN